MPSLQPTALVLIATRITALTLVVPGLSARFVPWRARLLLAVLLIVLVSCVWQQPNESIHTASLPELVLHEIVVGISLALVPVMMMWGALVALQHLQDLAGLPGSGGNSSGGDLMHAAVLVRFFYVTMLVIFFLVGGHRQLVQSVLESFRWLPPGQYAPLHNAYGLIMDLFSQSFALGVRAVSPMIAALMISLFTFAAVNRIVPQFGYLAVGLNLQMMVLLASLVLFLGALGWMIEGELATAAQQVQVAWERLALRMP